MTAKRLTGFARFERALAIKLHALNKLGQHLGMFGSYGRMTGILSSDVANRHREPGAIKNIRGAIWVLLDPNAHPTQHAAAGMMLEYYWPTWRTDGPPELIGHHVERDSPAVLAWRMRVIERDGFQCQHCGSSEDLHAHHIVRWADAPSLRTADSNGITLCQPCHITEHAKP